MAIGNLSISDKTDINEMRSELGYNPVGGGGTVIDTLNDIYYWRRDYLNKRICTDYMGNSMNFTQYPKDWLPNQNYGFDIRFVYGVDGGITTYNPPLTGGYSDQNYWWNVLTFGIQNRCTQIAFFAFNGITEGLIYMRVQHDSNVSGWMKVL